MASMYKRELRSRKDGKPRHVWVVAWRQPDGRQRRRQVATHAAAIALRGQVESGQVPDEAPTTAQGGPVTVAACVEQWTATRRVSKARTAAERSLVKRFGPLLHRPVAEVRPSDVRALVAGLTDEGLSAETVGAVLRTLRAVLDTATEDGHLTANPAARVRPPRVRRPPLDAGDVYTAAEARQLVVHTPQQYRALMALLVYVGPRWSEAIAVRRHSVDLLRGRVHLGHEVVEEVAGSVTLRQGGKTRSADRWVTLPEAVRQALAEHVGTYQPAPDGLLFTTRTGEPLTRGNWTRRVYRPAVESAVAAAEDDGLVFTDRGIPVRNLRHTAASLALAAGLPVLEVAHRLGHSRPSVTLDTYSRFLPEQHDGVGRLDAYLAGGA